MPSMGSVLWNSCEYKWALFVAEGDVRKSWFIGSSDPSAVFPVEESTRHLARSRMRLLLFYDPALQDYPGFIWKQLVPVLILVS